MDIEYAMLRFSAGGKNYRLRISPQKASTLRAVIAARAVEGKVTPLQVRQRMITTDGSFDNYVFTVLGSSTNFSLEFPVDQSPAPRDADVTAALFALNEDPWTYFSLDL